jgi:hypothetical protein
MKRSKKVTRILLSSALSASVALGIEPRITPESFYTNDYHIPGAGYYHAPFRAFYPQPYTHFDTQRRMYFYGGQWGPTPHRSILNISAPTPEAANAAQNARVDIARSGFGSTSRSHYIQS